MDEFQCQAVYLEDDIADQHYKFVPSPAWRRMGRSERLTAFPLAAASLTLFSGLSSIITLVHIAARSVMRRLLLTDLFMPLPP